MGRFRLLIEAQAEESLLQLPFPLRRQVNQAICRLREDPFPEGSESFGGGRCRLRVYNARVLFLVDDAAGRVSVYSIES